MMSHCPKRNKWKWERRKMSSELWFIDPKYVCEIIWGCEIQSWFSRSRCFSCFLLASLLSLHGHFSPLTTSWLEIHVIISQVFRSLWLMECPLHSLAGSCRPTGPSVFQDVLLTFNPGELLLIWRTGSWVEIPGWKESQNVSCGSSSADAAQSRSWRRCTWHKTRWLYLGSGALRQREEMEGWRSVAICFPRAHFGFRCGDYCYFLE